MDGIVLLKEDHKTVEKLFKQFEKAGDDAHTE
ncbi:hemerythrin domain-containing protein, partial [Streptomyces sp. NPDC090798]